MKPAILVALALGCGASSTPPSPPSSKAALPRIERIERGLLPAVQIQGEDMRFTLEDRMREYKIAAVSIAVFDDYQLQWAKAYGLADEVLRLIATVFPESSNAHDSLGEALARTGDKARAITEYELSIKLLDADPRLTPEARAVRRKHAEEELAKLRE